MTASTVFLLMAEFGQVDIPLESVAEKYLALAPAKAKSVMRTIQGVFWLPAR